MMRIFIWLTSSLIIATLLMASGCKNTQESAVSETNKSETTQEQDQGDVSSEQSVQSDVSNGASGQLDEGMSSPPAGQLARLMRTPCFGRCPMYRITVMDNGELVYEGKRFVEKLGTYSGLVTGEDVETLIKLVNEVEYFKLEDAYDVPIADFPTCVTTVNLDGKSKSIMNKQGAPEELKRFEKYMDSLIEGLELRKMSDEVSY